MARMVGTDAEHPSRAAPGRAVVMSVADVEALGSYGLDPAERGVAAKAAMNAWGLAGVGLQSGADWTAVALIAPPHAIPRYHPLSAGGIEPGAAGLILFHVEGSALVVGKRLGIELARRLRGQVAAIEAQGTAVGASALAPSVVWLRHLGFHPVRYPVARYRLDLDNLATWLARARVWLRPIGLAQPLPANRSA